MVETLIEAAASRVQVAPADLYTAIHFETAGTMSPTICNAVVDGKQRSMEYRDIPAGGRIIAMGLIQWTLATLKDMPRYYPDAPQTFADLSRLDFSQQLDLAVAYLNQQLRHAQQRDLSALYLAIFWPSAMNYPDDAIITEKGRLSYDLNHGLDRNRDGVLTRGEIVRSIHRRRDQLRQQGRWVPCWEKNPPECTV